MFSTIQYILYFSRYYSHVALALPAVLLWRYCCTRSWESFLCRLLSVTFVRVVSLSKLNTGIAGLFGRWSICKFYGISRIKFLSCIVTKMKVSSNAGFCAACTFLLSGEGGSGPFGGAFSFPSNRKSSSVAGRFRLILASNQPILRI